MDLRKSHQSQLREGVVFERDAFVEPAFGDAEQFWETAQGLAGHAVERNRG